MPTIIDGTTGVSQVQTGSIKQDDLAANVVGKGPAFIANRVSTSQVITTGMWNKLLFNNTEHDTTSAYDKVTNFRFTPQVAGFYQTNVSFKCSAASGLSSISTALYKNGSLAFSGPFTTVGSSTDGRSSVSGLVYLNGSTDYIEAYGYATGTTLTMPASSDSGFSAVLVRAA